MKSDKRWTVQVMMLYSQSDECRDMSDEVMYATPFSYRHHGGDAFVNECGLKDDALFSSREEAEEMLSHLVAVGEYEEDPFDDELNEFPDTCRELIVARCVIEWKQDS